MPSDAYELLALGMRYWFALLGLVIVLRAARWAWHDRRVYQRTLDALPDAGLMGELVNLDTGEGLPLPREGIIGSGAACDIRLKGLRKREASFELQEGLGVKLTSSHRRHQILLDGEPLGKQSYGLHGSRLSFPGYFLRMRLFEGLDIPARARDAGEASLPMQDRDFDIEQLGSQDALGQVPFAPPPIADSYASEQVTTGLPGGETRFPQITWVYAAPPPDAQAPASPPEEAIHWQEADGAQPLYPQDVDTQDEQPPPPVRRRRRDRHG